MMFSILFNLFIYSSLSMLLILLCICRTTCRGRRNRTLGAGDLGCWLLTGDSVVVGSTPKSTRSMPNVVNCGGGGGAGGGMIPGAASAWEAGGASAGAGAQEVWIVAPSLLCSDISLLVRSGPRLETWGHQDMTMVSPLSLGTQWPLFAPFMFLVGYII